jgi:membrane dipeptidase
MSELGFSLDLAHMDEKAALQALDFYPGQIIASHGNALRLLNGSESNRHLTDRVIHGILERDGTIGLVPFNAFLKAGWKRGDRRDDVQLDPWVSQIDYICQMAGDARHAGIGSDFDGGFGLQSVPIGIDTIADLQILGSLLSEKGYAAEDIAAILGGNWISRLREILP